MPVGCRKSEASPSPRVSLFLLLPLLPPNVPQNCRMSVLRHQTVDPQCRRYYRRPPLTESWACTRSPFPRPHQNGHPLTFRLLLPCIRVLLRLPPPRCANRSICRLSPAHAPSPLTLSRARPPRPELGLRLSSHQSRSRSSCSSHLLSSAPVLTNSA
jgi:hypothetical protein